MAVIDKKDIYSGGDPFAEVNKSLKELDSYIAKLKNETKQYADELRRVEKTGGGKEAKKRVERTEKLSRSTKQLTEAQKARKKINQQLERTQAQLNEVGSKRNRQLERNKQQLKSSNALQKKIVAAQRAERNSVDKLQKINGVLVEKRKNLNLQTDRGRKLYDKYTAKIKSNEDQLKQHDKVIGRNQRNVGNYTESIQEAVGGMGDLSPAADRASQGIQGLKGAFRALMTNPIVAILAAIAGALITLFKAFKQTSAGAELMNKITGTMQGLMGRLRIIATEVADALVSGFKWAKETLSDLVGFIRNEVIGRFQGLIETAKGLISLDWQQAKDGMDKVASGANNTAKNFNDAQKATNQLKQETKSLAQQYRELNEAQRDINIANVETQRQLDDLRTKEERYKGIVDDETRSWSEREKAEKKARKASQKRVELEEKIAKRNLELARTEFELAQKTDKDELQAKKKLLKAENAYQEAKRETIKQEQEANERRRKLQQDKLEQEVEILIEGADTTIKKNREKIRSDEITAKKRQKILEKTQKQAKNSFNEQIKAIKEFSDVEFNAQELLEEGNSVVLKNRIRQLDLNEKEEKILIDALKERRKVIQELNKIDTEETDDTKTDKEKFQEEKRLFEKRQELQRAKFKDGKRTAQEQKQFELQQERDKLQRILELNREYGGVLSEVQKKIYQEQLKNIKKQIGDITGDFEQIKNEMTSIAESTAMQMGETLGNFFASADKQNQKFLQSITMSLLNAIESAVTLLISKIVARELADKGLAGAATGAVLTGIVKGLFNQAKQTVRSNMSETSTPQYAEGGEVGGKKHSEGGTSIEAEKGEYVVKADSYGKSKELVQAVNAGKVTDADYKTLQNISVNNSVSNARLEKLLESTNAQMQQNTKVLGRLGNVFEYKGFIYKELASGETIKLRKA